MLLTPGGGDAPWVLLECRSRGSWSGWHTGVGLGICNPVRCPDPSAAPLCGPPSGEQWSPPDCDRRGPSGLTEPDCKPGAGPSSSGGLCGSSLRSEFLRSRAVVSGQSPPSHVSPMAPRLLPPTPVPWSLAHHHVLGSLRAFQRELLEGTGVWGREC